MFPRGAVLAVLCATCVLGQTQAADEPQVVLEVRLVSVSEPFFERIGIDFSDKQPQQSSDLKRERTLELHTLGQTFLTDEQVFSFLEAMQGDRRGKVLQFPRMTLLNQQVGTVECTDTKYFLTGLEWVKIDGQSHPRPKNEPFKFGCQISTVPAISADRRSVHLHLKVQQTDLTSPVPMVPVQIPMPSSTTATAPEVMFQVFLQQPQFSTMAFEKTLSIPTGRTAVFSGLKRQTEVRTESGTPILSKIKYINRLFKNVGIGQETETLLVFVTPRILVDGEMQRPVSSAAAR